MNNIIKLWDGVPIPFFNETYDNEQNDGTSIIKKYILDGYKRPAVIVFPGGGYTHRAAHEGEPVALWLNSLGINAFVLNYRVSPYTFPAPFADANKAVGYVRENAGYLNVDSEKIGVLGFSAGGHLACLASNYELDGAEIVAHRCSPMRPGLVAMRKAHRCSPMRPDICILCYPVISLVADAHRGSTESLLGSEYKDLAASLSGENIVTESTPPTFIWHTANDASVNVSHSLNYAKALAASHVPVELHVFPEGRHGLGLAAGESSVSVWKDLCATWLTKQGFILFP